MKASVVFKLIAIGVVGYLLFAVGTGRIEPGAMGSTKVVEGEIFPDFSVVATDGEPLSLGQYRGKVVLIDFWATWCGPCLQELPNLQAIYERHHAEGFEVVGISLDKSRAALDGLVGRQRLPWRQFFDGKGWDNELSSRYGIRSLPATFLIDREGKVIATGLRGRELATAVAAAVKKGG